MEMFLFLSPIQRVRRNQKESPKENLMERAQGNPMEKERRNQMEKDPERVLQESLSVQMEV